MSTPADHLFSFSTRLGLVFIVEASFLSALAVTAVLVYIGYSAVKIRRQGMRRWKAETEIHFYFVNLMIFDLIQAIGCLMDIKWVKEAKVIEGPFCKAQGAIKQFGNVGIALSSLTITIHTLCVLAFRWDAPPRIALVVISFIWLFVILIIGVTFGVHKGPVVYKGKMYTYYGDTNLWCWITQPFVEKQGIGLEYFWLWLAAFLGIFTYVFLALLFMNFIAVDENNRLRWLDGRERKTENREVGAGTARSTAMGLLLYPFVFLITVLPHSVARWTRFASDGTSNAPSGLTFSAAVLFSLNGLFNVVLFALTRPGLFPSRKKGAKADIMTESDEDRGMAMPPAEQT